MQKLNTAAAGKYNVKWIYTEPEIKKLLSDIRIEVGKEITVISNKRFGTILLRSEAGFFALEKEAVMGVTV